MITILERSNETSLTDHISLSFQFILKKKRNGPDKEIEHQIPSNVLMSEVGFGQMERLKKIHHLTETAIESFTQLFTLFTLVLGRLCMSVTLKQVGFSRNVTDYNEILGARGEIPNSKCYYT